MVTVIAINRFHGTETETYVASDLVISPVTCDALKRILFRKGCQLGHKVEACTCLTGTPVTQFFAPGGLEYYSAEPGEDGGIQLSGPFKQASNQ